MIKIPMFPFHSWLPHAHVESPTIGSIILAAILLKLGTFGIYRYSINLFNPLIYNQNINNINIYNYFLPIIFILAILSIIYCSFNAIRSIDFKKIIAYSSIVHMNYSIFGFFSNDFLGLYGSTYLMFTHAFISSALFLLIGILYIRYHTRIIFYYKGLIFTLPLFSFFFLFFSFANISIPFTSAFISEILILISSFKINPIITLIITISLLFSTVFVIWLANRILFSQPITPAYTHSNSIPHFDFDFDDGMKLLKNWVIERENYYGLIYNKYIDLSLNEFLALLPMFILTIFFGIFTKSLFNLYSLNLINILF